MIGPNGEMKSFVELAGAALRFHKPGMEKLQYLSYYFFIMKYLKYIIPQLMKINNLFSKWSC